MARLHQRFPQLSDTEDDNSESDDGLGEYFSDIEEFENSPKMSSFFLPPDRSKKYFKVKMSTQQQKKWNLKEDQYGVEIGETEKGRVRVAVEFVIKKNGKLAVVAPKGTPPDPNGKRIINSKRLNYILVSKPSSVEVDVATIIQKVGPQAVERIDMAENPEWVQLLEKATKKFKLPSQEVREKNRRQKRTVEGKNKKQTKSMEETVQAALNRFADQKYYITQYLYHKKIKLAELAAEQGQEEKEQSSEMTLNPIPNEADIKAKRRIFRIISDDECVVSHMLSAGSGDHMFEINGYAAETGGVHGRYDGWNTIPVVGSWNKSYKKIPVIGDEGLMIINIGRILLERGDIGYQDVEWWQWETLTRPQKRLVIMFRNWKEYCKLRGACPYFRFNEEDDEFVEQRKAVYEVLWDVPTEFGTKKKKKKKKKKKEKEKEKKKKKEKKKEKEKEKKKKKKDPLDLSSLVPPPPPYISRPRE